MSDKQKAFLSILLGAIIGGATAAVTKIGLVQIPPLSFVFLRFFIASMNLYLIPIFAHIAANIFLAEQLTKGIVIGGIFAPIGVFFVTKNK